MPPLRVALLEQFGHVYAAIEDELMVNANDPHLSPLYDAFFHKLHRAEAFQQDVSVQVCLGISHFGHFWQLLII